MSGLSANRQKQHERFLLECFFEDAELQAEIVEEREAPDFVVRFEGRLIGVEVTELFISPDGAGSALQVQESISTRIVNRAQKIYRYSDAPPAHVSVCFGPGCDLRSLNRERTAEVLASFIRDLDLGAWERVDWRPEELDGRLPYEVSFVHALGVPSYEMAHWSVQRAGWVASLTESALQACIDKKSKRLPVYGKVVQENWLLVVADRSKPSQLFDLGANLNARSVTSQFSRSFFYGYPEKAVIELGV